MKKLKNGKFKFSNGRELLEEILCGTDLYKSKTGQYVFLYNDNGSIATYELSEKKVQKLREEEEPWSWHLGVGGYIYDKEDDANLHWCEDNYKGEWEMV